MDRKTAGRLEIASLLIGFVSFMALIASGCVFLVGWHIDVFVGGALAVAVVSAALLGAAMSRCSKCQPVLKELFVEHEGVVASVGQTKEQKGVVTFGDGYVVELDFGLMIEPGSHLTVWRDGWDHLKRLEVKRA